VGNPHPSSAPNSILHQESVYLGSELLWRALGSFLRPIYSFAGTKLGSLPRKKADLSHTWNSDVAAGLRRVLWFLRGRFTSLQAEGWR
jgi:hypothetical protein